MAEHIVTACEHSNETWMEGREKSSKRRQGNICRQIRRAWGEGPRTHSTMESNVTFCALPWCCPHSGLLAQRESPVQTSGFSLSEGRQLLFPRESRKTSHPPPPQLSLVSILVSQLQGNPTKLLKAKVEPKGHLIFRGKDCSWFERKLQRQRVVCLSPHPVSLGLSFSHRKCAPKKAWAECGFLISKPLSVQRVRSHWEIDDTRATSVG